jgi:hypothetical protein
MLGKRTIVVEELGPLQRAWWGGGWHGSALGVRLRLDDPAQAPRARALLGDRPTLEAALRSTLADAEVTVPLAGQPVWERLEVGPEGSLAVFAVPWDDEHRWGVRVDAAGNVAEVIISP